MPATKPTWFKPWSYNQYCQRCNCKTKAEHIKREWTGLLVCEKCFEERNQQDFTKGVIDDQSTPWNTGNPVDTFVVAPPPGFNISTMITGSLTAPFSFGPENIFDNANTLSVSTNIPLLPYSTTQDAILAGANMAALYNGASAAWEVVQFQTVAAGMSGAWNLTALLRGRVGTENAMASTAPIGSPFYYLGQSSASLYDWINNNLFLGAVGLANASLSPYGISATHALNGKDIVFSWIRRSKTVRIDQPDIDPIIDSPPLGEGEEWYSVDILNGGGSVVATLNTVGAPSVIFTAAEQIAAFGSLQPTNTIRVYQVSKDYGRGNYRQATITAP